MAAEEAREPGKKESMEDTKVDQIVIQKKGQTDLTHTRPSESSASSEKSENKENSCLPFSRRSSLTISSRSTTSGYVGDCEATGGSFYAWSGPSTDDKTSGSEKGEEDETNFHFLIQQRGELSKQEDQRNSTSRGLGKEHKDERKQPEVEKILPVVTALEGELRLMSTENRAEPTPPSHMTTVQGEESKQLRDGVDTVTKDSRRLSTACHLDTPRCLLPFPRSSLRLKELRNLVRPRSNGEASSYQVWEPPLPPSSRAPSSLSPPWGIEEKKLLLHHKSHSASDNASFPAQGKHHPIQRGLHGALQCPTQTGNSRRSVSSPCSSSSPHGPPSPEDWSQLFNPPDGRACSSKGTDEGHSGLPYERTISSPRPLSPSVSRCTSPSRRLGSLLRRRPSSLSAYHHRAPSPLAENASSRRSLYAKPELDGTIPCLEDKSFFEAAKQHRRSVSSPSVALPLSLCPVSPRRSGTSCLGMKTDKETKSDLTFSKYSSCADPSRLSSAYSSRIRTLSSQDCSTVSPALSPISGSPSSSSKDMTPTSPFPTFCKSRRGGESFRAKLLLDLHRQRESQEEDFYELTTARHVEEVSRLQREMAELKRELRDKTLLVEASEQELSARTEEAKALTWQAETARERQAKERKQRERLEAKVRDLTERLGEGEKTARQRRKERDSAWMKKLNEERDTFKAELAALQKEKAELEVSTQRLRDQVMKLKAQARRRSEGHNKGEATLEKELEQVFHHSHSLSLKSEQGDHPLLTADKGEEEILHFLTEKPLHGAKESSNEQRAAFDGLLRKQEISRALLDSPDSCTLPSNTPLLLQSRSMATEDLETMCLIDDGDAYIVKNEEASSEDKQESPSFLASELFLKHTASSFASHKEKDEGQSCCHLLSSLPSTKSAFSPFFSSAPSSSSMKREGESSLTKSFSRALAPERFSENDGGLIVGPETTSLLPRIIRAKSLAEEIAECGEEERSLLHRYHMEGKDASFPSAKHSLGRHNHQDSQVLRKEESSEAEKNNPGDMVNTGGDDEKRASPRDTPGVEDAAFQKAQLKLMDDVRPPELKLAGLSESLVVEPGKEKGLDRSRDDLLLLSPVHNVSMKDLEKFIDLEQGGTEETLASEGERDPEQLLLNSDRTSEDHDEVQTDSQDTSRNDKTLLFVSTHPEKRNEDLPYASSTLNPPGVNRLAFRCPSLLSSESQGMSPEPPCSMFSPSNRTGLVPSETDSHSPPSPPRCSRKVHTLWNVLTRRSWNLLFWICPRRRRDSTESFDEDDLPHVDETTALMDSPPARQN